jgi:hypothetical protein
MKYIDQAQKFGVKNHLGDCGGVPLHFLFLLLT